MADTATHSGAMKIVYPIGMKLPLRSIGPAAPVDPAAKAAQAVQKHKARKRRLPRKKKK